MWYVFDGLLAALVEQAVVLLVDVQALGDLLDQQRVHELAHEDVGGALGRVGEVGDEAVALQPRQFAAMLGLHEPTGSLQLSAVVWQDPCSGAGLEELFTSGILVLGPFPHGLKVLLLLLTWVVRKPFPLS